MVKNERLRRLIAEKPHAVAGYLTAGYPDRERFFSIAAGCAHRGLSILEAGFPSENPYADGEVIRRAHACVDPNLREDLGFWRRLREQVQLPVWIMGYYRDLTEQDRYLTLAAEGLADAFVIPDAGTEQLLELKKRLDPWKVELVPLLADSQPREERDCLLETFDLIYQQLYQGVTGMDVENDSYRQLLGHSLKFEGNRLFAGFGIHTPERVRQLLSDGFYGTVVGTALMRALNQSEEELYRLVEELCRAAGETGQPGMIGAQKLSGETGTIGAQKLSGETGTIGAQEQPGQPGVIGAPGQPEKPGLFHGKGECK